MVVSVKQGKKDGQPVWWVLSITKTGTHRLACCEDKKTAEGLASLMKGDKNA